MTNELETDALLPLSLPVLILPGQPRKVGTASTRPAGSFCLGCMSLLDHHYLGTLQVHFYIRNYGL